MCSEIQTCAEQRCSSSSSTSNTAFAGTLYRERTNTSILIASSKLILTSTNFIQNLFWVTKHRLCTKINLWLKLYVAQFSFKNVIHAHTHKIHKLQNQWQFVVVFWNPIKFEIWDFFLRTFPFLLPPFNIKLTRILHRVRRIFLETLCQRYSLFAIVGWRGEGDFKSKSRPEQMMFLGKIVYRPPRPTSNFYFIHPDQFVLKKDSYDHSWTKLLISYWSVVYARTQCSRMTFRTLTLAFGWNIMWRWSSVVQRFIFSIYNLICSILQSYTVFHHPRHAKTNNKTFAFDKATHGLWNKQASHHNV